MNKKPIISKIMESNTYISSTIRHWRSFISDLNLINSKVLCKKVSYDNVIYQTHCFQMILLLLNLAMVTGYSFSYNLKHIFNLELIALNAAILSLFRRFTFLSICFPNFPRKSNSV